MLTNPLVIGGIALAALLIGLFLFFLFMLARAHNAPRRSNCTCWEYVGDNRYCKVHGRMGARYASSEESK